MLLLSFSRESSRHFRRGREIEDSSAKCSDFSGPTAFVKDQSFRLIELSRLGPVRCAPENGHHQTAPDAADDIAVALLVDHCDVAATTPISSAAALPARHGCKNRTMR
jgi:hypothetical protein